MSVPVFSYDFVIGLSDDAQDLSRESAIKVALRPFSPQEIVSTSTSEEKGELHQESTRTKLSQLVVEGFQLTEMQKPGEFPLYAHLELENEGRGHRGPPTVDKHVSWRFPSAILHLFRDPAAIEWMKITVVDPVNPKKKPKKGQTKLKYNEAVGSHSTLTLGGDGVSSSRQAAVSESTEELQENEQEWKFVQRKGRGRKTQSIPPHSSARLGERRNSAPEDSLHANSLSTMEESSNPGEEGSMSNYDRLADPERQNIARGPGKEAMEFSPKFSRALSILSIPSYMSPLDIANYLGPFSTSISHIRLFRDTLINRSIALLLFRSSDKAYQFLHNYNGKRFHFMEPEVCHVVCIRSVRVYNVAKIPRWALPRELMSSSATPNAISFEMPTCPVCLEILDASSSGLLAIACQHSFHCKCLRKWGQSSCPVCRYTQRAVFPPSTIQAAATSDSVVTTGTSTAAGPDGQAANMGNLTGSTVCGKCGASDNVWICLICGNVGCGRYAQGHARDHYAESNHVYSLEIGTQRVWDYAADEYVHRLVQNREDGKIVEVPGISHSEARFPEALTDDYASLLGRMGDEEVSREYAESLLLQATTEMDRQRHVYEAQINDLKRQVERATKRTEKAESLARIFESKFKEEVTFTKQLRENVKQTSERCERQEQQIGELQETVKDLMTHVMTMDKLAKDEELRQEMQGGDISVGGSKRWRAKDRAQR